jgi:CrcB protein
MTLTVGDLVGLAAAGGSVGALLRVWLALYLKPITVKAGKWSIQGFPAATLAVNLIGCFILGGVSSQAVQDAGAVSPFVAAVVGSGFCGGFTTMSTFALDTISLLLARNYAACALYYGCTIVVAPLFAWLGWLTAT